MPVERTELAERSLGAAANLTVEEIEAQNAWLAHWEERWAAQRIHGRAKRQVEEMFRDSIRRSGQSRYAPSGKVIRLSAFDVAGPDW